MQVTSKIRILERDGIKEGVKLEYLSVNSSVDLDCVELEIDGKKMLVSGVELKRAIHNAGV